MYLLPVPKKLVYQDGVLELPRSGTIRLDRTCAQQAYTAARLLKEALEENGGAYRIVCETAGTQKEAASIWAHGAQGGCAANGEDGERESRAVNSEDGMRKTSSIRFMENGELDEQEYCLTVDASGIAAEGGSAQALLYAVQTVRQMLDQCGLLLPHLAIVDRPDFAVRGFYHDAARGRVPRMEWLRELADTLSRYKINQLQLYIEHSFLFEGMSELWRDDTPLTAEDILEFDRYCAGRGIELVPSLASFGHLYKLLSTKQYRGCCERTDAGEQPFSFADRMDHHTVDVSSEEAFTLICGMIAQFLPLFSSRRFNICADETFDLGTGRNAERAARVGKPRLYIDYVKRLCEFVIAQGSTPMMWGDVLLGFPELAAELPPETICLNWGYDPKQSEDSTRIYAKTGVRQYVCPGVAGWNQFVNLYRASYENISRMSRYGVKYGCEGLLNTDWGDYGHINHPTLSIPGMIYGAAAAWNREAFTPYEELNRQISRLEYEDRSERFMEIAGTLSQQESFGWHEAVLFKERWSAAGAETVRREFEKLRNKTETEPEKYEKIRRCIYEMKSCMKEMDCTKRRAAVPYMTAAEGMLLWNRIGALLLRTLDEGAQIGQTRADTAGRFARMEDADVQPGRAGASDGCGRDVAPRKLPQALRQERYDAAARLEEWYYEYRRLWRSTSRESELYRIGEVVFWYADLLREQR